MLVRLVNEVPALHVLIVVVVPLHVENVEVREPVAVQICEACIAAPTAVAQSHGFGHIVKPVMP